MRVASFGVYQLMHININNLSILMQLLPIFIGMFSLPFTMINDLINPFTAR